LKIDDIEVPEAVIGTQHVEVRTLTKIPCVVAGGVGVPQVSGASDELS
jgi:hypothetical protein